MACSDSGALCNYGYIDLATALTSIGVLLVLAATLILTIVALKRRRRAMWYGVGGVVSILALCAVAVWIVEQQFPGAFLS